MRFEQCLALRIVLPGKPVVMPCGTVCLNNELLLGPAEVGDHSATLEDERNVDVGFGNPSPQNQLEDNVLVHAACWRRSRGNDPRKFPVSTPRASPAHRLGQVAHADEPQRLCLANGATQRSLLDLTGEIDKRASG